MVETEHAPQIHSDMRQWFWRGLTLLIAALLIIYLVTLIDWTAFFDMAGRLSISHMGAAFGIYLALNFCRSLRYRTLLDDATIPLNTLYPIALYHNFLVRLLPFKLGELTYIALLRSQLHKSIQDGVASLVGSRLLELLVIVLVALISLMLSSTIVDLQTPIFSFTLVVLIATGIAMFYFAGDILRQISAGLSAISHNQINRVIAQQLRSLAVKFDTLHQPRLFRWALFWSLFTYGCSFGVNWVLLHGLGIYLEPTTLVMVVSLGMFATAFPFSISGFGMVELSWTFGLTTLLSYSAGEAAAIGLLLNGFQILSAAISGLMGYLLLQRQKT